MKQCTKCKESKSKTDFHRNKNCKDGLSYFCKKCAVDRAKTHYIDNREKKIAYQRQYAENNKEEILNNKRLYYLANKKAIAEYKKGHAVKYRDRRNANEARKRKENPIYRLTIYLRNRTREFFKEIKRSKTSQDLIGCSVEELKCYIERQFDEHMSWDNYGKWHIDHKYPLSLAKSKEELEKLCHYSNLQPMWGKENIRKSNKI